MNRQLDFGDLLAPSIYVVLTVWDDETTIRLFRYKERAITCAQEEWQEILESRFEDESDAEVKQHREEAIINDEEDHWSPDHLPMHAWLSEYYYDSVTLREQEIL